MYKQRVKTKTTQLKRKKEAAACSLPSAVRTCRRPCPTPRVSRASSRPCLLRPVAVSGAPLALNPNHPVGGGKPGGVYLHLLSSCPPAVSSAVAVSRARIRVCVSVSRPWLRKPPPLHLATCPCCAPAESLDGPLPLPWRAGAAAPSLSLCLAQQGGFRGCQTQASDGAVG